MFLDTDMNNDIHMKRFEMVIANEQLDLLLELLKKSGILGYTLIKNVGGYGSRGVRDPHEKFYPSANVLVIFLCKEDQVQAVVDEIVPVRKVLSGMCIFSDCQRIQQ